MNRGTLRKIEVWLIDIGLLKEHDASHPLSSTHDMLLSQIILGLLAIAFVIFPLYEDYFDGSALGTLAGSFFWLIAFAITFLLIYGALSRISEKRQIRIATDRMITKSES